LASRFSGLRQWRRRKDYSNSTLFAELRDELPKDRFAPAGSRIAVLRYRRDVLNLGEG
jgi:hypothetical protein